MTVETNIFNWIASTFSPRTILFRNNTGVAKFPTKNPDKPRYVRYGVGPTDGGGSDSIGWTRKEITPDMVGKTVAIFTAIEIKTLEGDATDEQKTFVRNVLKAGGYAGFASTREDARKIINPE